MRRRDVIAGILFAAAIRPAVAQQDGKVHRIGVIRQDPRVWDAFFDELSANGLVQGKTLDVVGKLVGGGEDYDAIAAELVNAAVDAIVTAGAPGTRAAQRATQRIPILAISDDLVGEKFVASLAHPGGNVTGISISAFELDRKRQEILLELVPSATRLAILTDPETTPPEELEKLREDARARHVELSIHRASTREEIEPAIEAARAGDAQAINVLASATFNANRELIIKSVGKGRLPAMFQWPAWVEQGALVGYGPTLPSMFRQVARQLVKVLHGTSPGDIPVELPTAIDLAINLKTAKALGLEVPPSLLVRADEVIE
jgi:ABC-type uncharacterized transport system substrate-binding protein